RTMECRAYGICLDSQSRGYLGKDRKVSSAAGGNLSRMHKTQETAKESRLNFMYSHLRNRTLGSTSSHKNSRTDRLSYSACRHRGLLQTDRHREPFLTPGRRASIKTGRTARFLRFCRPGLQSESQAPKSHIQICEGLGEGLFSSRPGPIRETGSDRLEYLKHEDQMEGWGPRNRVNQQIWRYASGYGSQR